MGILEKIAYKSEFTPHALKGQKLLAQGNHPGLTSNQPCAL